jgi:hypothetical protein
MQQKNYNPAIVGGQMNKQINVARVPSPRVCMQHVQYSQMPATNRPTLQPLDFHSVSFIGALTAAIVGAAKKRCE